MCVYLGVDAQNGTAALTKIMRLMLLDCVRIAATVLVLVAHIGQTVGSPIGIFFGVEGFYYVSLGGLGVTIFLILSGLTLELRYGERDVHYLYFMLKRCVRIYPIYYLSLVLGFSIYVAGFYRETVTGALFTALSTLHSSDVILSLTGFYAFAGEWGGPFVATSWFIGLIMTMYLLYPGLAWAIRRRSRTVTSVLLLISVLSRLVLGKYEILPTRPLDWFPLCRIFEFSLGIYLARIFAGSTWQIPNFLSRPSSFVRLLGELSFPLFLIHYPLRFTIPYLTSHGANLWCAILVFLVMSTILSAIVLTIDKCIPRRHILSRFA